jgi:(p)ppGpp synthase/HD superfamily hydrolase
MTASDIGSLIFTADFAARKHRSQRRKDPEATPYINHPIAVADILARVADVEDILTLQAALLHDTLEDTTTTPEELDSLFGREVRQLVMEVTDDQSLPKAERKRLQILHAPKLSPRAKLIKLADKIANISDFTHLTPVAWPYQQKRDYLEWAEEFANHLRGLNPALDQLFEHTLAEKRALLTR